MYYFVISITYCTGFLDPHNLRCWMIKTLKICLAHGIQIVEFRLNSENVIRNQKFSFDKMRGKKLILVWSFEFAKKLQSS